MRFDSILDKIKRGLGPNSPFFHGERAAAQEEDGEPFYYGNQASPQGYAQADPQYYQNAPAGADQQYYAGPPQNAPRQAYAPPYQQEAWQPPQSAYAPPYVQQSVQEPYVQPRNRRSSQVRPDNNVVQFPNATWNTPPAQQQPQGYRQPAGAQQAGFQNPGQQGYQPGRQGYTPQGNANYQQPGAPQQEGQPYAQPEQGAVSARVINVRSIADCRNAISFLRAGDCVTAVMDSITDPNEMRRYVDTLNGASFSLGCTMTRVSLRFGVYLLAPASITVYTDQVTTQMNMQSRAPQRPRSYAQGAPAQGTHDAGARQQPVYDAGHAYRQSQGAFPPGADPLYAGSFSKQAAEPIPQPPAGSYSQQPPAYGYSPDTENDRSNAL